MITGTQVRTMREQLGLTQEGLARELNTTVSTISRWETGRQRISRMAQKSLEDWIAKNRSRIKREMVKTPPSFDAWLRMLDDQEKAWAEVVAHALERGEPIALNKTQIPRVRAKLIMYHVRSLLDIPS